MSPNSKTISEQFAALWEAEVRAMQLKQAEEDRLAQEDGLQPQAVDHSTSAGTATPAASVETSRQAHTLGGRLHVREGLSEGSHGAAGSASTAGPKIIVRHKRRLELPCISSAVASDASSDEARARPPRIFLLGTGITAGARPWAGDADGEHPNGFPDSLAFEVLSDHENRGMRRAIAKIRAPSAPVVTRLLPDPEELTQDRTQSHPIAQALDGANGRGRDTEPQASREGQGTLPFFESASTSAPEGRGTKPPKKVRLDSLQEALLGVQASLDLETAGAVLTQLRALEPAQTLAALLLVDRAKLPEQHPLHSAPASALASVIEVAWSGCNTSVLHKIRPLWYWLAAFSAASGSGAPSVSGSGPALSGFTFMTSAPGLNVKRTFGIVSSLSLFGLLAQANRLDALAGLPRHLVDTDLLSRPAGELTGFGAPTKFSTLALALQSRSNAFFDWLNNCRVNMSVGALRGGRFSPSEGEAATRKAVGYDRAMTRDLGTAIELWALPAQAQAAIALGRLTAVTKASTISGDPTEVGDDQLRMVVSMLQMGASLDLRSLLLLAQHPTEYKRTRTKKNAVPAVECPPSAAAWADIARRTQAHDRQGIASLQMLIAAEIFSYPVAPTKGCPNMMSVYVTGDAPDAVEMFLAAGFDPLLPDHEGLTPRDHGVRAGAKHATSIIDRQLAHQHLKTMKSAAQALQTIAI